MRSITILWITIIFNIAFTFGQGNDTIFVDDKTYHTGFLLDSFKHGEWKSYSDSIMTERVSFVRGVRDGEALKFYENGEVKIRAFFIEGALNGNVLFYSKNGMLIANYFYDNGIFDGNWFYISDENSPPTDKTYRPGYHLE